MVSIQNFAGFAYAKELCDLDKLRFSIFTYKSSSDFRDLHPKKDSLTLHVKHSAYQAGWIWGNALFENDLPSVEEWGWQIEEERLYIKWTSIDGSTIDSLLETCKCRTLTCKACKCSKKKVNCLSLCGCKRKCGQ